jgi:hypothetical protein
MPNYATAAYTPPKRAYPGLKVRAIKDGYYDDKLRRVGDVFEISGEPLEAVIDREIDNIPATTAGPSVVPAHRETLTKREQMILAAHDKKATKVDHRGTTLPAAFSHKWMELVDPSTPDKITTPQEVINRKHDDTISNLGGQTPVSPAAQSLPQGDDNPLGDV